MKTLIFVLVILENSKVVDEQMEYPSLQRCSWYAQEINRAGNNQSSNYYTAYCKPKVIDK